MKRTRLFDLLNGPPPPPPPSDGRMQSIFQANIFRGTQIRTYRCLRLLLIGKSRFNEELVRKVLNQEIKFRKLRPSTFVCLGTEEHRPRTPRDTLQPDFLERFYGPRSLFRFNNRIGRAMQVPRCPDAGSGRMDNPLVTEPNPLKSLRFYYSERSGEGGGGGRAFRPFAGRRMLNICNFGES